MTPPRRRVLLYADVDLNLIDGSSVWLTSMARALALTESAVDVLLKAPVRTDRLSHVLEGLPHVRVLHGPALAERGRGRGHEPLSAEEAARLVVTLDRESRYDVVVCRGLAVCTEVAATGAVTGRFWPYMTDVPQSRDEMTDDVRRRLATVVAAARRVFGQTEDARSFLEHHVPEAAGKVVLLPPMIPEVNFESAREPAAGEDGTLSLVYSGKLARDWRTLEMCALPRRMAERGVRVQVTIVGDKVHREPRTPGWAVQMTEAARHTEGVTWLGGMRRDEAIAEVARHDVGLSWRAPAMDASHELSTKVLEYAAAGVPPLLNRTAAHEELFGYDYPLYVDDDTVLDVLEALAGDRSVLDRARRAAAALAERFTIARAAERLETLLRRSDATGPAATGTQGVRVLVVSHDLKFAADLVDALDRRRDVDLSFDHWASLHVHDATRSAELLASADVVLCEWAGPNVVWCSRNKQPGQRLVVRLHMFELGGPWLQDIDWDAVDEIVCVSDYYADVTAEALGLPRERIRVIPNTVDVPDLERPKLPGAQFHLGIVGIVPVRKRMDRALDLLEQLVAHDDRFTLHIRGRLPIEYPWEWRRPVVRGYYEEQLARLQRPPLAGRVALDDFGGDIGTWLRRIGWILSPSTDESFHLAPMEGMASGAVPVIWQRDGADAIFGERWLHDSTESAAEAVLRAASDENRWEAEVRAARERAGSFDRETVLDLWGATLGLKG